MSTYRFPPDSRNTFRLRRGLGRLPRLVKRQRRLERAVAQFEQLAKREKLTRDEIDGMLRKLGLSSGEGVTCLGYDVVHWQRKGRSWINADKLRAAGVAELDIAFATETGEPALFATVRPMKGAEVQVEARPARRRAA